MTPTNQTKFSAFTSKGERITYGNCLVACIASVLDVDIHEVPNLYTLYGITRPQPPDAVDTPYWAEVLNTWMRDKHGKQLEIIPALAYASKVTKDPNYPRTCIVKGMSQRDKPHCCIYHLSTLIWDPHPSREGLKEMKEVYVITPVSDNVLTGNVSDVDMSNIKPIKIWGTPEQIAEDIQNTSVNRIIHHGFPPDFIEHFEAAYTPKPEYWKLVEERRERLSTETHNPLESHSIY